jgi:hypothetical protein
VLGQATWRPEEIQETHHTGRPEEIQETHHTERPEKENLNVSQKSQK